MQNGLPMLKPGSFMLVHDIDRNRRMDEMTAEHPHPVYEAFQDVVRAQGYEWCILKFIRKHLGVHPHPMKRSLFILSGLSLRAARRLRKLA